MTAINDERTKTVNDMFGSIVRNYDFLNHLLSCGIDVHWRSLLADAVTERIIGNGSGRTFLDLAAGTLDVSLAIHKRCRAADILAIDACQAMLDQGTRKLDPALRQRIRPMLGDARALDLPDGCADGITMAFGIRNIEPREDAFAEMFRVLKPGGRACVLEFSTGKRRIWLGLYNAYLEHILPSIGRRLSGNGDAYAYLARTIKAFPDGDELAAEMRKAGFSSVRHIPLTGGIVRLHVADKDRT